MSKSSRIGFFLLISSASLLWAAGPDTRLVDAVMRSDRDAVKSLLLQKVDVNATQPDGMTALHWAARSDDLEIVRLLIARGADVRATNRYGITPM